MKADFIEGVPDRTQRGLQAILLSQAKVRIWFAAIVVVFETCLFYVPGQGLPVWFACLIVGYAAYVASPFLVVPNRSFAALKGLLILSAITDPLMMTIWIVLTGEFSSLIAGFYLFTTLGFGFRTGRPLMHVSQLSSLIGFTGVLLLDPYWHKHGVVWSALTIPILIVPFYASTLIKTLRQAREHAEQQSRAKSDLLAKVSHELRTPLTGIVAATELLAMEKSSDRVVTRRTETILSLSDNLLREINDLLDEAKYDAAAIDLNPLPVDLDKKVSVLRTTFEAMAAQKGVAFRADVDPTITDLVVGDAHHLNRVLLNLAGNALKFTDRGMVRMVIERIAETSDSYRIRFSVSDTGIGIPESFHSKIFEPFSQVEQGTNRRYGGTGLGLALSKRIVELMGGQLNFESVHGKGSRFWFELNLTRKMRSALDMPVAATPIVVSPKRILVAEDNVTNLMLIQEMLHIDHHEVTTCTSGIAALEALAKQEFDLLLLDYNLGDMDGIRVLQTYQFGKLHPAPAIFLTADATVQTANRLKSAGAAAIVYKPVNISGIRKALEQINFGSSQDDLVSVPMPYLETAKAERPTLKVVPVSALDDDTIDELRSVNGRAGFLTTLLSHAENDITHCVDQLLEALSGRSYVAVPSVAHALKGVSANVGAVRLASVASNLMNMSSDEIDGTRDRLGADLRDASRSAVIALRKIASEEQPESAGADASALHLD